MVFLFSGNKKPDKNETNKMNVEKVYVETLVKFLVTGGMRPVSIVWKDGNRYEIDRVKFIERAPSTVGGLAPMRYVCVINGLERSLYYESDRKIWFVERRTP